MLCSAEVTEFNVCFLVSRKWRRLLASVAFIARNNILKTDQGVCLFCNMWEDIKIEEHSLTKYTSEVAKSVRKVKVALGKLRLMA